MFHTFKTQKESTEEEHQLISRVYRGKVKIYELSVLYVNIYLERSEEFDENKMGCIDSRNINDTYFDYF